MKNRGLSDEDYDKVFDFVRNQIASQTPDSFALLLGILMTTACRVDEALKLTIRDVNRQDSQVNIPASKGSNPRTPRVSDSILLPLTVLLGGAEVNFGEVLFPKMPLESKKRMLRYRWDTLRKELELATNLGFHSIRHTMAIKYLKEVEGASLRGLQLMLGHKSITSTTHYMTNFEYSTVAKGLEKIAGF